MATNGSGDRTDEIIGMLRERGGRATTPRRAIIGALLDSGGHITADELTATVQAKHPDVHLSTIYRCLDTLEELRVIDHVHFGHGRALYHLADQTHQHLLCEVCGLVIEVPDSAFSDLSAHLLADYGFTLQPRHFALLGRCRDCAAPSNSAATG